MKNRSRILGKQLKAKGCDVMFSGILPRLGNNVENMSRAIDVNQWLEEWFREEGFTFKKQWESFQGQRECFRNDGRVLNRKGAARFAVGIEEGIQAFFDQWRVEKVLRKELMMLL